VEKLIYLLGDAPVGEVPRLRADLRDELLGAGGALAAAGAQRVSFTVADVEEPEAQDVYQSNHWGLLDAQVSLWLDSLDDRARVESVLEPLTARRAGYLVTESVPREYAKRDWKDGERSPGVALVTTFRKPEALDDATFYARWHESHTPISLEIHPLIRYVRNAVARPLTPDAPDFRAIVSESVASAAIASDDMAFYGSRENRKRAVKDLLSFADLEQLSTVLMSEYIVTS
jgi:hypothetical protein